ncbi:MAG: aromatic ring-hydroxylating oxygenase subunit alpha [Myxococcaceae bacterium]
MTRTLAEKLALFDGALPLERARTIPSLWYTDPEVEAAERRAVFGASWQLAARADQLAAPGSLVTTTIAGEPILLVRDEQHVLRAFFNVCRHRAARVVAEPEGNARRLRCRYHGWTYDLAGRLVGTPEFEGVLDFQKEEQGLVPLAVGSWGPLVFVHAGRAPGPLPSALWPLPDRMGSLADLVFFERRQYELRCNWKVFVDNYLDGGYHVNTVHPALAGVLQYAQYKTECFVETSLQTSPLRPPESEHSDGSAASVRKGRLAHYGWAYPNFMVNLYDGVMDTNVVFPLGPDKCQVLIDFYFAGTASEAERRFANESVEVGHRIQLEDVGICEDVQRGMSSRCYDSGRFSVRREAAVHQFHRLLAARLRAAAPG